MKRRDSTRPATATCAVQRCKDEEGKVSASQTAGGEGRSCTEAGSKQAGSTCAHLRALRNLAVCQVGVERLQLGGGVGARKAIGVGLAPCGAQLLRQHSVGDRSSVSRAGKAAGRCDATSHSKTSTQAGAAPARTSAFWMRSLRMSASEEVDSCPALPLPPLPPFSFCCCCLAGLGVASPCTAAAGAAACCCAASPELVRQRCGTEGTSWRRPLQHAEDHTPTPTPWSAYLVAASFAEELARARRRALACGSGRRVGRAAAATRARLLAHMPLQCAVCVGCSWERMPLPAQATGERLKWRRAGLGTDWPENRNAATVH